MKIKAYGKINLALDVVGKREDGYHLLRMIMQTVNIYDELTFKQGAKGIRITTNKGSVPADESNLVYKAVKLFSDTYGIEVGLDIHIEKNIPVAAGMAGGSADAAAALRAMRELYKSDVTDKELMDLGVKIGADVPYCVIGGTALCEGIGELITPLSTFRNRLVVIVKPKFDVSTVDTYKKFRLDEVTEHPNVDALMYAMSKGDLRFVAQNMGNLLELVTVKEHKEIDEIKSFMVSCGALGSMMSGSGPTVFGLFENVEAAISCVEKLKEKYDEVFLTETV